MKTQGLGDVMEKFTKATGIKKMFEKLPGDCGCEKRKNIFNKVPVPKFNLKNKK
jgi:hypothetical protein